MQVRRNGQGYSEDASMSKKQQPKTAKRRASAGERIYGRIKAMYFTWNGLEHDDRDYHFAEDIDRAIRAAVKTTWFACENHESENSESHKAQIKGQIEQRFGVKL